MENVIRTFLAPVVAASVITYSLRNNQAFIAQYVANYIAQSIVMESRSLFVRTLTTGHLAWNYLATFVMMYQSLKKTNRALTFDGALDVVGIGLIGLSWVFELVLRDEIREAKRKMRVGLAVWWVLMSLKISIGD